MLAKFMTNFIWPSTQYFQIILVLSLLFGFNQTVIAQVTYSGTLLEESINSEQFQAPWDGPGSAMFNPATIAETKVFELSASRFSSLSGKTPSKVYMGAVNVYQGLCIGLGWFESISQTDGSSFSYLKSIFSSRIVYSWNNFAGSGSAFDFGLAYKVVTLDPFGIVQNKIGSNDLGIHIL